MRAGRGHPTEKPQWLLERLIDASTARGELVLDPFGGVATTAVAAAALGRRCWSCELDLMYHARGAERLGRAARVLTEPAAEAAAGGAS